MTSFIKVVEMLKKTYTQQITIDYFGLSQNTVINMLRTVGVHRAATEQHMVRNPTFHNDLMSQAILITCTKYINPF